MTTRVYTDPRPQTFSTGNTVNSNGKLYFREPGNGSTTLKNVYADKALTTPLVNPVILDSNGRPPVIYLNGDYNVQATDSNDVQLWRVDNYQPPEIEGQFDEWDTTLTYAVNDYVQYSNGKYYVSLQSGNTGNVPPSSPTYWSELFFITVYNASQAYSIGAIVSYNGSLWEARSSSTGTTPGTNESVWVLAGTPQSKSGYFNTSYDFYKIQSVGLPAQYNITSNVAKATYETIGPPGSGADNEYADYTPTDIDNPKAVIIDVTMDANKSTGSDERFSLNIQFRRPGYTNVYAGPQCGGYGGATHGQDNGYASSQVVIPCDENGIFEVYWNDLGSPDAEVINIRYLGVKA